MLTRRRLLAAAPAVLLVPGCTSEPATTPGPSGVDARAVREVVRAERTRDGAGVRLRRALGAASLPLLDPFLLLDEIRSDRPEDYVKGFPKHPHRGFETVTYMIDGAMEHRDSVGNHGRLVGGSVQWMTAGRGIIHSEMPQQERGLLWGLQLWVNLPKRMKMRAPRYQDIAPARVPELAAAGARVRLVAGERAGVAGPVEDIVVGPTMLDVALEAGARFEHELAPLHTAFAYVLDGAVALGPEARRVAAGELAVLGEGAIAVATSEAGGRFLLLAAAPIGEPVARRGPFVMNTEAELDQAFDDYRSGRLVDG